MSSSTTTSSSSSRSSRGWLFTPSGFIKIFAFLLSIAVICLYFDFSTGLKDRVLPERFLKLAKRYDVDANYPVFGIGFKNRHAARLAIFTISTNAFGLLYYILAFTFDGARPGDLIASEMMFLIIQAILSIATGFCALLVKKTSTSQVFFGILLLVVAVLFVIDSCCTVVMRFFRR